MTADVPMPAIREAVLSLLPHAHPDWKRRMRDGELDDLPMVQAAFAGWQVAMMGARDGTEA